VLDGKSVATWLVCNGYAMDWPHYSEGEFARDHDAARAKRAGIWQGDFMPPWEARLLRRVILKFSDG
jgi:endonuclease YncB( thermonuclease family)